VLWGLTSERKNIKIQVNKLDNRQVNESLKARMPNDHVIATVESRGTFVTVSTTSGGYGINGKR